MPPEVEENEAPPIISVPVVETDKPADTTPPTTPAPTGPVFSVEDIEKARQEEKSKLYPAIDELKGELATLRAEREEREKREAKEADDAAKAAKKAADEDKSAKELLAEKENEWQAKMDEMNNRLAQRDAMLEKEREFAELERYRLQRLGDEDNEIIPALREYVQGDSPDEIERAIATAKQKSADILAFAAAGQAQRRQESKGTSVTSPPVGPMDADQAYKNYTQEEIQNMPMSEWVKVREQLMRAASPQRGR
jgi:hypothetical protein